MMNASNWSDDLADEEYPDEWDDVSSERDAEVDWISCPHCGAEIYEEAVECPVCQQYVTRETRPAWIWRATAGLLLAIVFAYLLWRIIGAMS